MGVAGEIGEHLFGAAERSLGMDDPGNGPQRSQAGGEQGWLAQARQTVEKPELARIERRLEAGQEKPAIEPRQHLHRQKEPRLAADPAGPVGRGPATRHEAVHMGMMMQVLSPGVQDRHQPDLGAEVLGIGGDDAQRLGVRRQMKLDPRIASPENVPERSTRCLTPLLPLPQRSSAPDLTSPSFVTCLVAVAGPVELWATRKRRPKRSGKSTGRCSPDAPPLENCAPLPARSGSTSVVPNTIWCATSRRQSFIRRWSVLNCPSG